MELLEIAVGKLVSTFSFFIFFVVYAEMPFGVIGVSVLLDDIVFLAGRRLVFTPRASVVDDILVRRDQTLCVIERFSFSLTGMAGSTGLISRRFCDVVLTAGSGRTSPVLDELLAPTLRVLRRGAMHPG